MYHLAEVILPTHLQDTFTYLIPDECKEQIAVGKRVLAPFGKNRTLTGLIYKTHYTEEAPKFAIKPIKEVLDEEILIDEKQIKLFEFIANYYCCTLGEVFQAALPANFKLKSKLMVQIHPFFDGDVAGLDEKDLQLLRYIMENAPIEYAQITKKLDIKNVQSRLKYLREREMIVVYTIIEENYRAKTIPMVEVAPNIDLNKQGVAIFDSLKNAPKQSDLFMIIVQHQLRKVPLTQKNAIELSKSNLTALKALVDKGLVIIKEIQQDRNLHQLGKVELPNFNLKPSQIHALNEIDNEFAKPNSRPILLHGVTGSGKTQVYIETIKKFIAMDKQVLFLLPEIALTKQIIQRLMANFGEEQVGVYHSRFSDNERIEIWNKVKQRQFKLVIAVRSGIFLPFQNLGLIIIDEEHESTFKQHEPNPRYHARDVAHILANLHGAKLIFGSATPSMESYYNAMQERYKKVDMHVRISEHGMPEIVLVDMKKERKERNLEKYTPEQQKVANFYSDTLLNAIEECLAQKKQVILFQNRRGYAPMMECMACGYVNMCQHCDISLTVHKNERKLKCHYCGYQEFIPLHCPNCDSTDWRQVGIGTERIEQDIQILFPEARIARMDLDTTRGKNNYIKIITDFEQQKTDILIGTQMVSKGLDFETVGVVGVIDADQMLRYPDFRASERAFQMLTQVSGRAGRGNEVGKVILQTLNPKHPVLTMLTQHQNKEFYEIEMESRRKSFYPPLCRLIFLELRHKDKEKLIKHAQYLAQMLKPTFGDFLLGPEFALIPRVKNEYHMNILLKIDRNKSVSTAKQVILNSIRTFYEQEEHKKTRIIINVDPA
ncbi:MAG: primosomal protein N' [Bacteroidia bacterium]|nr:primosomal protein N' [Bacteroidia bacterium]MDW8348139.1 primosomal protein N' [Bacteroidia bacterium]